MKVLGLLVVLPILVGFTDAAVTVWTDGTDTTNAADATFTVASDENIADTVNVVTVTATGSGAITYSIATQTNSGQFEVSATGAVSLVSGQTLDREAGTPVVLNVEATDAGDSTTGTCTLTITVNDLNDNTPVFTAPATSPHYLGITDGSTASTALYTVTGTDADATDNTITYSINSGNTNNDFAIDGTSGAITVATGKTLDKSTTAVYTLVIHATDSGTPADSASATVIVVLCDSSENGTGNLAASFLSFVITLLTCVTMVM